MKSNSKQLSCTKVCCPQEGHCEKKSEIASGGGYDGNNNDLGEFVFPSLHFTRNSPELLLLKFLPLAYHHSYFLAATLDFTSFFTMTFLGAAYFLQLE